MAYSLSRSALLNLSSYLYLFVVSLSTTPYLIRHLGLAQFSQYVIALGYLALVTSLDLGLSRAVVYYHARATSGASTVAINSASLLLHLVLGLLFGLLTLVWFSPSLALLAFLTIILSHFQTYPESQGRFGLVNLRAVLVGTTNTIGAAILASLGFGVETILVTLCLASALTIVIFHTQAPSASLAPVSRPTIFQILSYGLKLQLGKLTNALQSQYPKLLFATNPVAVAVYSLSSSLVAKAAGAVSQLAIAFFPMSVKNANPGILKTLYLKTQLSLLVLALGAVIGYQYFGLSLLTWWLSDPGLAATLNEFMLTYRYVGLLLILTPLASTLLESRNRPGLSSLYGLIALLIELAVVVVLQSRLGILSVAYGNLLGLLIMVPVLLYSTQKNGFPGGTSPRLGRAA